MFDKKVHHVILIIVSNNLQITDVKLTGLYCTDLLHTIFFLNKGIMFASFHSKGTVTSCSDMLNTCASGILICSTVSFSIFGDIPSTPGDLFFFILLILLATTSGVTTNCPNPLIA